MRPAFLFFLGVALFLAGCTARTTPSASASPSILIPSTAAVTLEPTVGVTPNATVESTPSPTVSVERAPFATVTTEPTAAPTLEICKVVYDPPGPEPDDELIRLCNHRSTSVDVSGWLLSDGEGVYTIPAGTIIAAGGSWDVYGSTYNPTRYTQGLFLGNKGDCLELKDLDKTRVDYRCWS